MNEHDKDFQHAQQVADETAALTEQIQIKLSDAEFEHFQQLVDAQPAVPDRLKQAAQLLDQEGF
ncbi:type II toxin -antitoxin system TacA 1-like antitoxin [Acinetobacter sp. ANC 5383]